MTITATPSKAGAKVRKKSHICKHMQDFFSFIREYVFSMSQCVYRLSLVRNNRLKGADNIFYRAFHYHLPPPPPGPPPPPVYELSDTDEPPVAVAG